MFSTIMSAGQDSSTPVSRLCRRAEERSPDGSGNDLWDRNDHDATEQGHQLGTEIFLLSLPLCDSLLRYGIYGNLGLALRCSAFWGGVPTLFPASGRPADGCRHH